MSKFTESEIIGRNKFKSWLDAIGATDIEFTKELYCAVDCVFTYKNIRFAAEIKVRAEKYKDYDTHMLEQSKLTGMILYKEENKEIDKIIYTNFFGDWLYIYGLKNWYETETMELARTTAVYSGVRDKEIIWLEADKAIKFKKGEQWEKQ